MQTADLVLAITVPLVAMLAGWVGVEMSLTPPDRLTEEERRRYRTLFVLLVLVAISLNVWQTARNAKEQEAARITSEHKDEENRQTQTALSNKVSEQSGKLDAIAHFEQQFLTFVQQRPTSDAAARAYETMASAVIKLAQGSTPAPPPPPGGRLEIAYEGSDLNGRTLTFSSPTVNMTAFHTKNVGTRATGAVSARLYFNKPVGSLMPMGWQPTESEEPGFVVCFYATGMPPIIINPKETWNWAPFVGTYPSWQPGETITARLKVFYGTDKPSEADFTLRRQ